MVAWRKIDAKLLNSLAPAPLGIRGADDLIGLAASETYSRAASWGQKRIASSLPALQHIALLQTRVRDVATTAKNNAQAAAPRRRR